MNLGWKTRIAFCTFDYDEVRDSALDIHQFLV